MIDKIFHELNNLVKSNLDKKEKRKKFNKFKNQVLNNDDILKSFLEQYCDDFDIEDKDDFEEEFTLKSFENFINEKYSEAWYKLLCDDATVWNEEVLNSNIPVISHEYNRIKDLLCQGQYFGVLLQIKDFLEILLKFPVLIIINEKFNTESYSDIDKAFILSSLDKPLSLGHWHELATYIKKNNLLEEDSNFSKMINNIIKLYNKNDIIKWRNDEIGHGALSLDDDKEFQEDIASKFLLIKKSLDENIAALKSITLDMQNLTISYQNHKYCTVPFFNIREEKIFFFDSYLSRKQKTHQLNYCYGKKIVTDIPEFNKFMSENDINERDKQLSNAKIEAVRLAEDESKLDKLETNSDFVKPEYLITWLKDILSNQTKGKILLQMQRGIGKSLFCKALDQIALNKIELDDDMILRAYYINDIYRYSLSDFVAELGHFILNKKLSSGMLVDVFKGKLPILTTDSTKEDLAYMLNWYKQEYDVEKLLLIIDGVDEIPKTDDKSIFDILPSNEQLDDGIFILVTSRTSQEITDYTKEYLEKLDFISQKTIQKQSEENISVLKEYVKKSNLIKDEAQITQLIQKADYRLLYLNMLKEILQSSDIDVHNIPSSEKIIDYYLLNIEDKYGGKYYSNIFNILTILAASLDELTIQEIALLNNDANLNLKLIANMFDLRAFIKKIRTSNGNKFALSHISLKDHLNDKYKDEIISYIKDIYSDISSFSSHDEADIYKMAYLQKYEALYDISLSKNLKSDKLLDFLLNLNHCEMYKRIKIVLLLYKINIKYFFDFIIEMEKTNNMAIVFSVLDQLKLFGDTRNTIKIIEMIIEKFDAKSEEYLKLHETLCDMTHLEGQYEKAANLLEELVDTVKINYGQDTNLFIKYSIRIAHHRMFFSNINLPWQRMTDLLNTIDNKRFINEYAEIMFMLGGNLAALKGNFKEGIGYLNNTIKIGKEINDKYLLSRCMRKMSDYYRFYGDIKKANELCSEGIKYTDDEVTNRQRIYLYATQAENYRKSGDYIQANKYFNICRELSNNHNIKGWVANSLLGLSETNRINMNENTTMEYLMSALHIYRDINMSWGIIHSKIAMALVTDNIDKKILNEALVLAKNLNYEKDIEYIEELLTYNFTNELPNKLLYHELMFL